MKTALKTVVNAEVQTLLEELRSGLTKLYGRHLKHVLLYGSWARGEATEDSDIDVVVVIEGSIVPGREIDRMLDLVTELGEKYGTLISVYPVSERNYRATQSPLLVNVRREGVEV
jgi:predicted nucleotidyltransferase